MTTPLTKNKISNWPLQKRNQYSQLSNKRIDGYRERNLVVTVERVLYGGVHEGVLWAWTRLFCSLMREKNGAASYVAKDSVPSLRTATSRKKTKVLTIETKICGSMENASKVLYGITWYRRCKWLWTTRLALELTRSWWRRFAHSSSIEPSNLKTFKPLSTITLRANGATRTGINQIISRH